MSVTIVPANTGRRSHLEEHMSTLKNRPCLLLWLLLLLLLVASPSKPHLVPLCSPQPFTNCPSRSTKLPDSSTSPGRLGVVILRNPILAASSFKYCSCCSGSVSCCRCLMVCCASARAAAVCDAGRRDMSRSSSLYRANTCVLWACMGCSKGCCCPAGVGAIGAIG
jgi:hypothetical protein